MAFIFIQNQLDES